MLGSLERNLKILEGKRKRLNSCMLDLSIGSCSSYGLMKNKDKIRFVLNNIEKRHLSIFDDGTIHNCSKFQIRLPLVSCIARRFLPDHPAHKKCKRCEVLDKFLDIIILEIESNEE